MYLYSHIMRLNLQLYLEFLLFHPPRLPTVCPALGWQLAVVRGDVVLTMLSLSPPRTSPRSHPRGYLCLLGAAWAWQIFGVGLSFHNILCRFSEAPLHSSIARSLTVVPLTWWMLTTLHSPLSLYVVERTASTLLLWLPLDKIHYNTLLTPPSVTSSSPEKHPCSLSWTRPECASAVI